MHVLKLPLNLICTIGWLRIECEVSMQDNAIGDDAMDAIFFHPKIVHLPVALGMLMPLVSGAIVIAWWRNWLPARAWLITVILQSVLVVSGVTAMKTGEMEEERVERVVSEHFIEEHEEAAETFVWAAAAVLAAMLLGVATSRLSIGLSIATAAALATLIVMGLGYRTGQAGGALVYQHGAASAYDLAGTGAIINAPARTEDMEDDDH